MKFIFDDKYVEIVKVEERDNKIFATIKCWVQVKINGSFYSAQKPFEVELLSNDLLNGLQQAKDGKVVSFQP